MYFNIYISSESNYCPYPEAVPNTILAVERVKVGDSATYMCR